MNMASLKPNPEPHVATIHAFANLIKEGFQNPEGICGTVKLHIPEHPKHDFIVRYGNQLTIEHHNLERPTDTFISIPISTITRILQEAEYLDFRDPNIIGTMEFSGNLDYANHLGKSCLRPSRLTKQRFHQISELHGTKKYKDLTTLQYLYQPTQIQVLEAMEQSLPIVITGLEPNPPCKDWSLDKLANNFGDAIVRVRSATQKQTMGEFVQELEHFIAEPHDNMIEGFIKPYTEGAALPEAMYNDFGPLFFDQADFMSPQLWLGAVPTHIPTSSLHRDPHTGFLLQVMGRKRLDLYSADQENLLYPHSAYNNYQPCWFKPEQPDFLTYPKAKSAQCISVTLEPGEIIVQPAGWFHQVYALDSPNMSVSYFWRY